MPPNTGWAALCVCGHELRAHRLDLDDPRDGIDPDCARCSCMEFAFPRQDRSDARPDPWRAVAPIRSRAIQVLDTYLEAHSGTGETWSAADLVDALIGAGLLPDETHQNE